MDVSRVKNTTIFHGMSEKEIADALEGLNAVTKKYKKGTTILHAGSMPYKKIERNLTFRSTVSNLYSPIRKSDKSVKLLQQFLCSIRRKVRCGRILNKRLQDFFCLIALRKHEP